MKRFASHSHLFAWRNFASRIAKHRRVARPPILRQRGIPITCAVLVVLTGCAKSTPPPEIAAVQSQVPAKVDYNWDVRPILSGNCFSCHGNDAGKRKAGLRLDNAEAAYAKVPADRSHRAIVPGHPEKSELIRRLFVEDTDERMPPIESHKTLTSLDKATLWRWVEQGGEYKPHWAYVPPSIEKPEPSIWQSKTSNEIDRYVFPRLRRAGLAPSPEADPESLINRVSLTLTGLPPTLPEVDAFLADKRPEAYERLIDRLLASPAYGERMAAYWLDVSRYGESDGYLDDNYGRLIYPWRDWVISAFNKNMPYDQFITWQLAGDKLKNPTREQILATAFGRVGKRSTEAGLIDEEYRVEYRNERAELVGKAFLGLTVGCAKCHDHKYDVISQKDYYSLTGFFNSMDERGYYGQPSVGQPTVAFEQGPTLLWPGPHQDAAWKQAKADLQSKEAAYKAAITKSERAVAPRVDTLLGDSAASDSMLRASLERSTLAYYPLDEASPGSLDALKYVPPSGRRAGYSGPRASIYGALPEPATPGVERDTPIPDPPARPDAAAPRNDGPKQAKAAGPKQAKAGGASQSGVSVTVARLDEAKQPVLPQTLRADLMTVTPSGRQNDAPAYLENAHMVPGVKGQAFLVNDSHGFLGPRDVGKFERNQAFALDVWIKPRPDKPYQSAPIVDYQDLVGDTGYSLNSRDDRVSFDLVDVGPSNMIRIMTKQRIPRGQWTHITATYDGSSKAAGTKLYVNGKPAEVIVDHDNLTRTILPPVRFGANILGGGFWGFAWGKRWRYEEFNGSAIDEIRIFNRALTPAEVATLHSPEHPQVSRDVARASLTAMLVQQDPEVASAAAALTQARGRENEIVSRIRQVPVMGDQPVPRKTYVLNRGVFDQPTDEVQPQGLDRVFEWDTSLPRDRTGLAQWLVDPRNPLTSRVFINRLWAQHFGSGIVGTVEDFGTQGSIPTNPQLLDYLAAEFVRSGWDIKHVTKLMLMSATYRQSSVARPETLEKDPRNALFSRGPRFRLPAEMIRDNALFASGLLVDKRGGDSVFPYQPEGIWTAGAGVNVYPTDVPDDQMHRRSLYTIVKRASPAPSMAVFDMADRGVSVVQRPISNTPLQALVLLNDVQYNEAYRKLAERALLSAADREQQVDMVFRLATRRRPVKDEAAVLNDYFATELAQLSKAPGTVDKLLANGVTPIDQRVDRSQLAALTMVTAAVMNSPDAFTLR